MRPHAWGFVILLTIAREKVAPEKRRAAVQRVLISEGAFASWLELEGRAWGELYARGLN